MLPILVLLRAAAKAVCELECVSRVWKRSRELEFDLAETGMEAKQIAANT